jgi:hypothetical protein
MRQAGAGRHGARLRGLIVVLWRGGLRIQEALSLSERDLDPQRGSLLVRRGKGGRRREIGMDAWGWEQLRPWLTARVELPIGPMFCVIDGPTRGRPWSSAAVRNELRRLAAQAGIRRRFALHQLRPRPRGRTCSRRSTAEHHPAPARARKSRHHLDLPARHRHRGDHSRRELTPSTNDARQRRPKALNPSSGAGADVRAPALPGQHHPAERLQDHRAARPTQASRSGSRTCAFTAERRSRPWRPSVEAGMAHRTMKG